MTDDTGAVAAVCIIAAIAALLLKQYCREYAIFCTIAACVTIGTAAMAYLTPVLEELHELYRTTALLESYFAILWMALGICYLTSIAGDLCRDCGETALGAMAELWGRIALVVLAMPLAEGLFEMIAEILG